MKRELRSVVWLLLFAISCTRATSNAAFTDADETPSSDFVAPDAEGWGRAAGLKFLEVGVAREEPFRNRPMPMVVLIHGLGDRPHREWAQDLGAGLPVRMVLPQAPTPWNSGFSWFEYRWPDAEPQALARGIREAASRVARMLATLQRERPTLGRPIVAGFSQGGMLSFALALEHPNLVETAVPISGTLPQPLWPDAGPGRRRFPPIRALHGTADPVVPFDATERLVARLHALGYDANLTPFEGVEHRVTREMAKLVTQQLELAVKRASAPRPVPSLFDRARDFWSRPW